MILNSPMDTPALNDGDYLSYIVTIEPEVADKNPDDNKFILS